MTILFAERDDATVRLANLDRQFPACSFELSDDVEPDAAGAWANYVNAAAQALCRRHGSLRGLDGVVSSDLPVAAGLSSSSALTVAATLSFLHRNDIHMEPLELMELVARGERYVGTEGGGMDQAICLGGRPNTALKIDFEPPPLRLTPTPCRLIGGSLWRTAWCGPRSQGLHEIRTTSGAQSVGMPSGG